MKINFKTVYIYNFMSIGEATIQLNDQGYTLVSGENNNPDDMARSNGSGKSSIFEAIVWCLTGDTMRGNKDIVNRNGSDGALVTVEFTLDSHSYKITRTKDHSKLKTNLLIAIDGVDKSGKGIRDSEKLLKEYLPDLTPSLIGSVIILGQGLPSKFTNNSPSGRKEVLEKLCKSDFMIEDLKNRISSRKTELSSSLRQTEDKLLTNATTLEITRKSLARDEELLKSLKDSGDYDKLIEELDINIKGSQLNLNDINTRYVELNEQLSTYNAQQLTLQTRQTDTINYINDKHKSSIDELTAQILTIDNDYKHNVAELKKLQSIVDICPTCKQKLPDVHKPDTTELEQSLGILTNSKALLVDKRSLIITARDTEITKAKDTFQQQLISLNADILDIKARISSISAQRDKVTRMITEQQKQLTELTLKRSHLENNIADCTERINNYNLEIETLNKDTLYNNNVKQDIENRTQVINKFNTVISRDFRGYLLSSVIEFINKTAKVYAKDIFDSELIEFELDGNNISISYNNKEYEALSGGERQKVDLIIQFSIRDMLCKYTNFATNFLALDEIFDNLDDMGSQRIIDMISNRLNDISSVFIISHHGNELNIPCDNELLVVKDSSGVSSIK